MTREDVEQIAHEVREFFSEVPEFEWLSSLRCRGMRVFVGERLVALSKAGAFKDHVTKAVLEILNAGESIMSVPPACRVRRSDLLEDDLAGERSLFALLLFPVVLVGAASEIDYCEDLVVKNGGKMNSVSEYLQGVLQDRLKHSNIDEPVFVPEYALRAVLERFVKNIDFELEDIL